MPKFRHPAPEIYFEEPTSSTNVTRLISWSVETPANTFLLPTLAGL